MFTSGLTPRFTRTEHSEGNMEASPSIWSTFATKDLGSASVKLVIRRRGADRHADAGDLRHQQARREMRGERIPLTKG